jgi:hypothetical protein
MSLDEKALYSMLIHPRLWQALVHYRVNGLGNQWPTVDMFEFDATATVMEFLNKFRRPESLDELPLKPGSDLREDIERELEGEEEEEAMEEAMEVD